MTFSVLLQCLPGFFFLGFGINFLLTALVPAWRETGWRHWKYFGPGNPGSYRNENSLLVSLGFVKRPRPDEEGDWDVKTAVRMYLGLGICFFLIGIILIIVVVRANLV
jgi:hypothetical protein